MKRKNKNSPTCILSADWHIRGDQPICRTDDYMEAQARKIIFIQELAYEHFCPILMAGDMGHRPIWGDKLLNWIIDKWIGASIEMIVVPGQHDLLNHRLDKWEEGGIGVLSKSLENFKILSHQELNDEKLIGWKFISSNSKDHTVFGFPYGIPIRNIDKRYDIKGRHIALCHMMVIKNQKEKLWPDQQAHSGKWFLKKYPCYDLIVTGDNHQSFVVEHEGRLLVNPGSLMRMSANQIDHKPSVYLWYAEDNTVERVYLPIEKNVISREHIEEGQQRDKRIESFVNRLKDTEELGLSYEKNMEEFLKANRVKKRIVEKIWESMG